MFVCPLNFPLAVTDPNQTLQKIDMYRLLNEVEVEMRFIT